MNIVTGQGAVNNIGMRAATAPGVEVLDDNNAPVADAEVIFQAPSSGPSGSFFGGLQTYRTKTDAKGRAQSSGFIPNDNAGKFRIVVRATAGAAVVEGVIEQTNGNGPSTGGKMSSKQKWVWTLVAVGAAVGIGVGVAAASGGSSSTDSTAKKPVTIGAGPITVGGPR